jgi:hypothetical protein
MQWEPYSRSLFGKLVRNLAIIVCTTKISDIPYAASLQYQSLLNERRLLLWTCEEYHQRLMGKVINLERLAKRANPTTEFQFVPLMHYNRQVPISSQSSYQVQKNSANNCASLAPDLSQSSVLDRTLRRESTSSTTNRSLSLNELMQRPSSSVNRSFLDKTLPIRMELNIHQLY